MRSEHPNDNQNNTTSSKNKTDLPQCQPTNDGVQAQVRSEHPNDNQNNTTSSKNKTDLPQCQPTNDGVQAQVRSEHPNDNLDNPSSSKNQQHQNLEATITAPDLTTITSQKAPLKAELSAETPIIVNNITTEQNAVNSSTSGQRHEIVEEPTIVPQEISQQHDSVAEDKLFITDENPPKRFRKIFTFFQNIKGLLPTASKTDPQAITKTDQANDSDAPQSELDCPVITPIDDSDYDIIEKSVDLKAEKENDTDVDYSEYVVTEEEISIAKAQIATQERKKREEAEKKLAKDEEELELRELYVANELESQYKINGICTVRGVDSGDHKIKNINLADASRPETSEEVKEIIPHPESNPGLNNYDHLSLSNNSQPRFESDPDTASRITHTTEDNNQGGTSDSKQKQMRFTITVIDEKPKPVVNDEVTTTIRDDDSGDHKIKNINLANASRPETSEEVNETIPHPESNPGLNNYDRSSLVKNSQPNFKPEQGTVSRFTHITEDDNQGGTSDSEEKTESFSIAVTDKKRKDDVNDEATTTDSNVKSDKKLPPSKKGPLPKQNIFDTVGNVILENVLKAFNLFGAAVKKQNHSKTKSLQMLKPSQMIEGHQAAFNPLSEITKEKDSQSHEVVTNLSATGNYFKPEHNKADDENEIVTSSPIQGDSSKLTLTSPVPSKTFQNGTIIPIKDSPSESQVTEKVGSDLDKPNLASKDKALEKPISDSKDEDMQGSDLEFFDFAVKAMRGLPPVKPNGSIFTGNSDKGNLQTKAQIPVPKPRPRQTGDNHPVK